MSKVLVHAVVRINFDIADSHASGYGYHHSHAQFTRTHVRASAGPDERGGAGSPTCANGKPSEGENI